jgi:hypothetical protein
MEIVMKPIIRKLSGAVIALILTIVMVVTASYAWFTFSSAPIVDGIQVSVGGGNTILIAPDVSITKDGKTHHYPGRFDDTLIFSQHDQYDYLKNVVGLTPISTSDGVHWYMAERYDYNDPAVMAGEATVGGLKPISEFSCDENLTHANVTEKESELARQGSYVYLDFWVVSPGADYTLRVSTRQTHGLGGSFLLETKQMVRDELGGFVLNEPEGSVAASARVGFLVCQDRIVDESNLALYRSSLTYDSDYPILKGLYQQPGEDTLYTSGYRFTVYDPNADLHPSAEQGAYYITSPIRYEDGEIVYADMSQKLAVQLSNRWLTRSETTGSTLDDAFEMWKAGQNKLSGMSSEEFKQAFYGKFLQENYHSYVLPGGFVPHTALLYTASVNQKVPASTMDLMIGEPAGATVDTHIVRLERDIPQRIRMFIWLEGQDIDCQNIEQDLNFVLSIEFAGGAE